MSTKTTKKEARPLTQNEKKTIIIAAICVAMAIILGISLPLILRQAAETPDDSKNKPGDSNLYISNGHFEKFDLETTTFPKAADDWRLYTYQAPEEPEDPDNPNNKTDAHGFNEIQLSDEEAKIYAGVVDIDDWTSVVTDLGQDIPNPGLAKDTDSDSNIYMIATKQATNAGIISDSFSLSTQTSAKITINVNTSQLKAGSKAFVMIQKWDSSSLSAKEEVRYANTFEIEPAAGWQTIELYVFNRQTSSQYVVCSIGIGDIYENVDGEGILFIDNVDYSTVTANDYRLALDEELDTEDSRFYILGKDKIDENEIRDTADYVDLVNIDGSEPSQFNSVNYLDLPEAIVEDAAYSPFIKNETLRIFRIANDGTVKDPVALKLETWNEKYIVVKSDPNEAKDHLHISFWVRVVQDNVLAKCNVTLQQMRLVDGKLEHEKDLDDGSFASIVTGQNIVEDTNCGWTKYDIYLKPTTAHDTYVRIVFSLGNINGYAQAPYTPSGTLFVTSPFVENITATSYSSASSGTYSKKLNLVGATATTSVTNGSFSSIASSTAANRDIDQPSSWTPVFAGYNAIYKDGAGNVTPADMPIEVNDAQGHVERNAGSRAPRFDDSEANYLQITNNVSTSYGYLSSDITLSAKTVYVFSVLAKAEGNKNPYFYVVKNGSTGVDDRPNAVIGKVESKADGENVADDSTFALIDFKEEEENWTSDGWTRYYIIIVTGDTSETVRVALFNGSIDGKTTQQGTVCYDYVSMATWGTYSFDTTEYEEDDEDAPEETIDRLKFSTTNGYGELTLEALTNLANKEDNSNAYVKNYSDSEWVTMIEAAMEKANDGTDPGTEDSSSVKVNWTLLTSVISSVALVGSLLIVVVIRQFKKRNQY